MKKNGFTLVEILAVVVIISALAIVSVPSIINYINNSKNKISEVTQKIIFAGADLYINNNDDLFNDKYQKTNCVTLNDIVDSGYLEAPIIDSANNKEINLNKFLKATLEYDDDLQKHKFNYEIVDECTQDKFVCVAAEASEITTGNIPKGNFTPGDEYICEVQDGTKYNFFVLSTEEDQVNLILDSNISVNGQLYKGEYIPKISDICNCWTDKENNSYGPNKIFESLLSATKNWDNVTNIQIEYQDEGNNYGKILTQDNTTTIFDINNNEVQSYNNLKARLATKEEINNLLPVNYKLEDVPYPAPSDLSTTFLKYIPSWLSNYLNCDIVNVDGNKKCVNSIPVFDGYWLMASKDGYEWGAYDISATGAVAFSTVCMECEKYTQGIRPVIEVNKTQIKN